MDEYISIAKEKHGYNTEQVGVSCVCVCDDVLNVGAFPDGFTNKIFKTA